MSAESLDPRRDMEGIGRRGRAWETRGGRVSHLEIAEPAAEPLLLDSREVARLLGIGRTKVFQMMARSELPTVRIGRSVRVFKPGLLAWLNERSGGSRGAELERGD